MVKEYKHGVTIFTPTYNRKDKLKRLYDSLLKQEVEKFEWLIVDDGSTDASKELIAQFIEEQLINIRYIYKANGGKHTALNVGMREAYYEYFLCVDSDDFLEEDAIKTICDYTIDKKPFGIISYKSEYGRDGIIGEEFPEYLDKTTLFDLINNYNVDGDRTLIFKTELLQDIFIPEPEGTKFFPETYVYDCFDKKYTSDLMRKSICCCEYLENGYSANFRMLMINNSVSMKWFYSERIDFPCTLKQRFYSAFRYIAYSFLANSKDGKYKGSRKGIFFVAFPFGLVMYIKYYFLRRRYGNGKR